MLKAILNHTAPENLVLKLYKSNTTPAESDTAGTYTEADFTGYSSASLTGASWSITPGDPSFASYAQQTFTSSAGAQSQSVYGYYIVQASSGILIWAERFPDGPYVIVNNGDQIKITPRIELA
jgi:hypothetical protein